jgi:hypothetical protein
LIVIRADFKRLAPAVALTIGLGTQLTFAAEPTQQELLEQVKLLQQKVEALEQKQMTAVDVDATVEKVLRDADHRSQLLPANGAVLAGYDSQQQRFVLRNADNSFSLSPQLLWQFRNITNYVEDGKNGGDDIQNGFELRRVKFELEGTAFSPNISYFLQWNSSRSDGTLALEDAWLKWMFSDDWGFRAGQFKDPFSHEELTSDKRLLTVDRSLVNQLLGPGGNSTRVQGVTLIYGGYAKDNPFNIEGGLTDGAGSVNTNFQDSANGKDWGSAARAEYKVTGDWKDYRDESARNDKQDLLVLGAGVDVTDFVPGSTTYSGIVDVQWETTSGIGVYASGLGQYNSFHTGGDSTNYGGLVQVGYSLDKKWEVFGRADDSVFDDGFNGEDTYPVFSVGFTRFFGSDGSWGHRLKATVELDWLPNGAPTNLTGIGYLAAPGENEIVLKAQLQFYL